MAEKSAFEAWRAAYDRAPIRQGRFATMSGVPLAPVYGTDGAEYPGVYPYTRGVHASMYRSRLWTMRMFAGFGTALDTNERFREIIRAGGTGLSTAFDMPTLLGLDSDDPMSLGEVGRCGVAVDTLADVHDLFREIDLATITTSMTINSPAAVMLALFVAHAESVGVDRSRLGGTLQNDILKEYQAQKEFVFPPRPSMRLVRDTMAFTAAEMPKWNSISVSGYHIREAGSTAAEELAFTLANGFAYVELAGQAGLGVDEVAPRLSFFFNAHIDFFEEIAKYRAARRLWATWLREHYGAADERSWQLRFHTQTAGVSLTAQQPEINIARTAIEALAGVLGGTQSLHTNSMDEALALPSERAARIALRTQQIIAYETNVANVADPLGGSWFIEALTDELAREAEVLFAQIAKMGEGSMLEGCIRGIEENWFQGRIADSAYELERAFNAGERTVVGVNDFTEGNDDEDLVTLQITNEDERKQLNRLATVRRERDDDAVRAALERLERDAADPDINLMPALIEAATTYASVGEMMATLEGVFGRYVEVPHAVTIRVLVAKVGLDGHDRGIKVVARILRDAGMEVVYTGLFQTPETVAAAAVQEDVDVVGLSMLSGAHMTLAPLVVQALRERGSDVPVVVGGIVPPSDLEELHDLGVAAVFRPGASAEEIVATISGLVATAT